MFPRDYTHSEVLALEEKYQNKLNIVHVIISFKRLYKFLVFFILYIIVGEIILIKVSL